MKIALLASTFLPRIGGAEIVVHNLARQFRAQGHDARVITWWGQWKGIRGKVDYPVLPLLPRSYSDRARRRWQAGRGSTAFVGVQVAAMQRFLRFDVWNIHMAYPAGMLAAPALHRLEAPFVTTCHGDDIFLVPECGLRTLENPAILRGVTRALTLSSRLTAISRSVRNRYLEMGVETERIDEIPNGTDVERIQQLPVDRERVRQREGWPLDQPVVLLVGRYHKQKGYEDVPGLVSALNGDGVNAVWVLVGTGAPDFVKRLGSTVHERDIRAMDQIPVGARFDSLPPDKLIELMKAADLLVLPSRFETFGLVLLEAMAAGLPVCATDVTGCRDLVQHGKNGLLAPLGDIPVMARHIKTLLENAEQRSMMIRNGLAFARQFDWKDVAGQYLQMYEALLSPKLRSGRTTKSIR